MQPEAVQEPAVGVPEGWLAVAEEEGWAIEETAGAEDTGAAEETTGAEDAAAAAEKAGLFPSGWPLLCIFIDLT